MRIAVFVECFPPKLGSDRRIYELMKRLSKKHEIHFIVLPPFRMLSGKLLLHQGCFHLKNREVIAVHHGITAHYIQIAPFILKLWKKSYIMAFFLSLVSLFSNILRSTKKINPEIIILNYPSVYTGFLGFIIGKKLLGKTMLLDFNDLIAQYTVSLLNLKPCSFAARFCILIQEFIVRNSDKVIVPTNYLRRYALNLATPNEKVIIIPNGVDTKYFDPRKYSRGRLKRQLNLIDKKVCLYCGRLDSWAGIDMISQFCKKFKNKNLNVYFVLVGSGAKEEIFFPKNAVLMKEVPYEKVPEILEVADVVLVPFPDNEVSRAASPLKLFEGMAMSKAVVASEVDGIKEVISNSENGVLVNPNNITEWVEAILNLLSDDSLARKIGANARRTVEEKYDWDLLANRYEKVFTEKALSRGYEL